MTDKVYIATSGDYDDYRIDGVFTDEALCDLFIERHTMSTHELRKEVHESNPGAKYLADGLSHFRVTVLRAGEIYAVHKYTDANKVVLLWIHVLTGWDGINRLEVQCWARDEQHARDIAKAAHTEVTEADAWGTPGMFEPKDKETKGKVD